MKYCLLAFCLIVFPINFISAQNAQSDYKDVYISKIPKPVAPAILEISNLIFIDKDGNNDKILDANENGEISFDLVNRGKGDAYNLSIELQESNGIEGLNFSRKLYEGNLNSKKSKEIKLPIFATSDVQTGKAKFSIKVIEANGFDSDPVEVSFFTQSFKNPDLKISDYAFNNVEAQGKITLGHSVNLKMIIQNQGQGVAKDISILFSNPPNVFQVDETHFRIEQLRPNESRTIDYEFLPNKRYVGNEIPIEVEVNESFGKYGFKKSLSVSLEDNLLKTLRVDIDAQRQGEVTINKASLNSDVDRDIPTNKKLNSNRYALIIGNEEYSKFQSGLNSESNVEFAINDAQSFKLYCSKTLGVPESNIFYFINATSGTMNQEVNKLNKIIKNSEGQAEIIFYYAGHGLPDEQSKEAYVFPVDVAGVDIQSAIKLQDIYTKLSEFPSKRVTVFLDACFSGGGRNQGLLAARMIKTKPVSEVLNGNLIVFTASSGSESSLPWKEKQHGLFTYYLLKNIQNSNGNISYQELFNNLKRDIKLNSVIVNSKEQTPNLLISNQISSDWKDWSLY